MCQNGFSAKIFLAGQKGRNEEYSSLVIQLFFIVYFFIFLVILNRQSDRQINRQKDGQKIERKSAK